MTFGAGGAVGRSLLVVVVALLAAVAPGVAQESGGPGIEVEGVGPLVTDPVPFRQVETYLAVDPTDPTNMIATALAARPTRRGAVGAKVAVAVGVGLGYQLLAGMAGFFGLVADLSPTLVALVPPAGLLVVALWLLVTSR